MLFGERRRREERDRAEVEGSSFWTEQLDETTRTKLWYATEAAIMYEPGVAQSDQAAEVVTRWVLRELGLRRLGTGASKMRDIRDTILVEDLDIVFSVIEAAGLLARSKARYDFAWQSRFSQFEASVRETLREHRISFDFIPPRIVPLDSQELHVEVVEPVLRLLRGKAGWEAVEKAYQDALAELHSGKPEDAITDAAVALEESLSVMGCAGNTLSKKMKDARSKGILASRDTPLIDGLVRIGDWIEAERSSSGDAHNAKSAHPDDAWLVVHIVGALIRRLETGSRSSNG